MARHGIAQSRGTTLIEMLIVVVLMGILGVWGSTMVSDNYRTVQIADSGKKSADQLRYALDRLSRELREVKFTSATGYAVTSTLAPSATNIVFTRTISGSDVAITINKSGSTVTLGYSTASTSTIASQVNAFTIDFYTVDSLTGAVSATTSASALRYMVMSMTVTDSLSGQTVTERTRVTLRNS
jgi:prepilin-type N-terminal cleavage/methylation domain-containing protein